MSKASSQSPFYQFLQSELNYVKKYFKSATIDGIEHVTDGGKSVIRRVIWALILLSSLGVCLFFLVGHGTEFGREPTSTSVRIGRPRQGLPFPAVTICNLNPVSKTYAEDRNISSFLSFFYTASQFFESDRGRCEEIIENAGLSNSPLTFNDILSEGSSSRDVLIRSCSFSVNGTSTIDCKDDMAPFLTEAGLCHTFNGFSNNQPDKFFQLSGSRYGLRIVVNISQSDYIASLNDDAGILVSVHHRHTFPNPYEMGITVPPGNHARIGVTSKRIVDNTGKGNCRDRNTFFPDIDYSTSVCRINARHEYLVNDDNCDCVEYINPVFNLSRGTERHCTLADACCIAEANFQIESTVDCLPPCDFTSYDTTVSYSKFPHNNVLNDFSELSGINVETIQDDIVSFNVYFSDLYIQYSETVISYGPRLLVADIGGTLGLFLGASIISFMEIFVLFFDEIKGVCCASKKVRTGWDEFELKLIHRGSRIKRDSIVSDTEDDVEEEPRKEMTPEIKEEKIEGDTEKIKNTPV